MSSRNEANEDSVQRRNKRRFETKFSMKGVGCLISTCAKNASKGKEGSEKRRGTGTKCICVNLWWSKPRAREMKKGTRVYGGYERATERERTEITSASGVVCEKKIERKRGRRIPQDTTYIRAETGYKK